MSALVFAPLRNAPGKHDAQEFLNEAHAFNRAHGFNDQVAVFDNALPQVDRRDEFLTRLRIFTRGELDVLALFCHGWPDGVQLGFHCAHARGLATELKAVAASKLTVALYCCSTGADKDGNDADERQPGPGGDGGFADRLRDELCDAGIAATVFAHSTAGHATRNPWVRVFEPGRRAGGEWLVSPDGPVWRKWLRALHSTDLRLRFPLMAQSELERELRGVQNGA